MSGSLRIVAAFSVAALLVVVGWQQGIGARAPTPTPIAFSNFPTDTRDYLVETDADSDGLPDWQELLMGTDPNNTDSDGDGVLDPDEPPSQPSPAISVFTSASSSESLSAADKMGEKLVEGYVDLKNKQAYSPERGKRLGDELATYVAYNTEFTPYTEDDIKVTTDSSDAALEAHRKALQKALEPFFGITVPEFVVYANYVESQDVRALAELTARAAIYEQASRDMLTITVPSEIVTTHLETINALSFFATVLNHMVAQVNDPIATLALLRTFNQSEQYVRSTFNVLVAHYRQRLFSTI